MKLISSTRLEVNARYSPDGRTIAFRSDRSGTPEIWICDSNGSNWRQVTSFGGGQTSDPAWSPDGKMIAFTQWQEGTGDIHVVSAEGGTPHRLTRSPFGDANPDWSPDGKWVYFRSNRSGEWQVWRMPARGGPAVQITERGGVVGVLRFSPDGRFVYFATGDYAKPEIWRTPAEGGSEKRLLDTLQGPGLFTPARNGIYFVSTRDFDNRKYLQFFDLAAAGTSRIMEMPDRIGWGLSASPDCRYILYTQRDEPTSDLMLVENFR